MTAIAALRSALYLAGAVCVGAGASVAALSLVAPQRAAAPAAVWRVALPGPPAEPAPAEMPPPVPPVVEVDSVAAGFALADWRMQNLQIGRIETAAATDDGAVLQVAGWAGDPGLGLRVPYVALGACGTAIAVVRVDLPRPDVAHDIHPHLDRAGWQARLFAAHLPDCEGRTIEAHALLPGGQVLVALAPAEGPAFDGLQPGRAATPQGPPNLIVPGDLALGPPVRAKVAAAANLRRCAQPRCASLGQMARGEYQVLTLDRRDGWALVHVTGTDRTGWLPETALERLPARVAQR